MEDSYGAFDMDAFEESFPKSRGVSRTTMDYHATHPSLPSANHPINIR